MKRSRRWLAVSESRRGGKRSRARSRAIGNKSRGISTRGLSFSARASKYLKFVVRRDACVVRHPVPRCVLYLYLQFRRTGISNDSKSSPNLSSIDEATKIYSSLKAITKSITKACT